jgi:DNA-binding transcriptional regulator YdaS (Cro superfamily)
MIMKALFNAVLVSCALAAPALAFAQTTNGPVTRAEVRADLERVEQAGYRPIASDASYPADIQAADAKVAAENSALSTTSKGGVAMTGSSQSGATTTRVSAGNDSSIYRGH